MLKNFLRPAILSAILLSSSLVGFAPAFADEGGADGALIVTATNASAGNELKAYDRNLHIQTTVSTGGKGTGSGLGNQGGIVVSDDTLVVVNAGDDTISSFRIIDNGNLQLASVVSAHGVRPVSVTIQNDIVYVVNAGDKTIAGFSLDKKSKLSFLAGSVRSLSGTAPAQIGFAREGRELIVTEKGTNTIEAFLIDGNNLPTGSVVTPSSGQTPFGFQVKGDTIIVSEAFGGSASALSTYRLNADGTLTLISPSVAATGQKAACWVATSKDGRFAFTTNTASASVSSFRLNGNGELELAEATAATTPPAPIDIAVSRGRLFVLTSQGIVPFSIGHRGTLGSLSTSALLSGANGLAMIND